MGNVSESCQEKIDLLIESSVSELENQALRGLYNYEHCCNKLQQVFKTTLLALVVDRYNDEDSDGQVLEVINAKQAECYCTWVSRNIPDETGGGVRWRVTYDMPTPNDIFINTPYLFAAITGNIDIQSSVGVWTDAGFGANAIGYGGNTTKNFNISVSVAVSSSTPVSVDYSWQKSVGNIMIYETTPQGSATTPGGNVPHATVVFAATWSPTQAGDLFAVQIRQNDNPGEILTLTTFNVVITEQ